MPVWKDLTSDELPTQKKSGEGGNRYVEFSYIYYIYNTKLYTNSFHYFLFDSVLKYQNYNKFFSTINKTVSVLIT